MKKRSRGNPVPLIVEPYPAEYGGYPFITLIQYRKEDLLAIVDNATNRTIRSFVLDLCGPAGVNEEHLIEIAAKWWDEGKDIRPISFEFSRLGMTKEVSMIYQTYNIEYVTRIIGPLPRFEMEEVHSIKRRKRKPVPEGIVIHRKHKTILAV